MIGCLRTRVRKQPIIMLYFESENVLKLYNLEAWLRFLLGLENVPEETSASRGSSYIWPLFFNPSVLSQQQMGGFQIPILEDTNQGQ